MEVLQWLSELIWVNLDMTLYLWNDGNMALRGKMIEDANQVEIKWLQQIIVGEFDKYEQDKFYVTRKDSYLF